MIILSLESTQEAGRQTHLSTMGTADSRPPLPKAEQCPKHRHELHSSFSTSCSENLCAIFYFRGFKSVTFRFYSHLCSSTN